MPQRRGWRPRTEKKPGQLRSPVHMSFRYVGGPKGGVVVSLDNAQRFFPHGAHLIEVILWAKDWEQQG